MTAFTEEQSNAIRYREMDACVVAGPGSGKTTVLVERYSALVERHGFLPDHILAITFTEKAAANMKARLAKQFAGNEQLLRDLDRAWVSTIHAFCTRILKENAIAAGVDPRFTVLDAREAETLQNQCLNAALDEFTETRNGEILSLIETLQNPRLTLDLLSAWDALRSSGKSLREVRAMPAPLKPITAADLSRRLRELLQNWPANLTVKQRTHRSNLCETSEKLAGADLFSLSEWLSFLGNTDFSLPCVPMSARDAFREFRDSFAGIVDAKTVCHRKLIFDILDRFEALYSARKAERSALDFDDLERRAVAMLDRDATIRDRLRSQFRQVMLDEFQDVNDQQANLIRLVRDEDVFFGVGDINQSIYGFRHARPEIFRGYHAGILEQKKHSAELLKNFRSHDGILRCVETLLHGAEGIEYRNLVAKELPTNSTPAVEILRVLDGPEDEPGEREARWIAHRILELREQHGYEFRHFAVLCRGGDSMKPILEAFDDGGIPYVCGRRDSVLTSREGRDLTALLYAISNPRDTVALATVLRSPFVGLSDEGLFRLRLIGKSISSGLNAFAREESAFPDFSPEDAAKLRRFTASLRRWRLESTTTPADLLLTHALADSAFSWLPGTVPGGNVEFFLKLARTRGADRPLIDFLDELDSLEKAVDTEAELSDEDQGDQVQVMTAHAAKGLEFPVTIIAAMQKGVQRDSRSVSFTPEHGLGIRWKSPVESEGAKDSWQAANSDRLKTREKEEGNRLLYVAMTRAEKRLILSWSGKENKWAGNWASMVERLFNLKDRAASRAPSIETLTAPGGASWTASVLVTAADPPYLQARAMHPRSEIDIIQPPPAADQSESAVAVTSLVLFNECPRKYYLSRYAGWEPRPRGKVDFEADEELPENSSDIDDLSSTELGVEVHDALAEKPGNYSTAAHRLASVFHESSLGQLAAAAKRVAREWEFIVEIEGMFVRGSIDLWFEQTDGSIAIVDYKTDEISSQEAALRAGRYEKQLAFYALALQRASGDRRVRAFLHFLKPNIVQEIDVSSGASESARNLVMSLHSAQKDLRFDLNPGRRCVSCAYYRELCPASPDVLSA